VGDGVVEDIVDPSVEWNQGGIDIGSGDVRVREEMPGSRCAAL
jgi:hypothetical protein